MAATLGDHLAQVHGGPSPRWVAWLRQQGLPPAAAPAQLTAAQRARLQAALARGLPAFAGHTAPAAPAAPASVVSWARDHLWAWLRLHRPWLLGQGEGAPASERDNLTRWLAMGDGAADTWQALPAGDPLVQALRSSGLTNDPAALRVWAFLEVAARHHPIMHTLQGVAWTGVARAVPARLAVAIACPGYVGVPHLPAARVELVPSRQGDLLRLRGPEADASAVRPAVAIAPTTQVAGLLQRVPPLPADVIPLVLPPAVHEALRELALRWQYRDVARAVGGSGGLIALFGGSLGHGRRTAARQLAADLGMELLKVQAGLLASRWIGETEQRISQMFSQAAAAGAALLVEDANDLFSRHVAANSANDRYANTVRNHLLQEIENFSGLVLLIAGGPHQFDSAMQRRIHVTVRFDAPDRRRRGAILAAAWQWVVTRSPSLLPRQVPDFEAFSSRDAAPQVLVRAVFEAGLDALRAGAALDDDALDAVLQKRLGRVTTVAATG